MLTKEQIEGWREVHKLCDAALAHLQAQEPGQTFADGVEAAINHLALVGVIKIDGVFAKKLRAPPPAPENTPSQSPMRRENAAINGLLRGSVDGVPSEADKLLRELENELDHMSIWTNSARNKEIAKRVQTYLKERG